MKLKTTSWLSLVWLLLISISSIQGQTLADKKVSGTYTNKPLDLILIDLKINYRLDFDYDKELTKDITCTADFRKQRLEDALKIILRNTSFACTFSEPNRIRLQEKSTIEEKIRPSDLTPTKFDFTLSGIVKDAQSGEALPFASILLMGTSKGSNTNVDGYFTLFDVPSDTNLLQVQYLGYRTKNVRLTPDMDLENLVIKLDDFSQQLVEVVVTAEEQQQLIKASSGISTIGFSPEQMSYLPSFGERDVFRSLQLLPGISGSNESSAGLYVRGGTPDQNLILFDGFTVYHVDHLFGFFSAFNANAIKDVQLHKGGFDAKFGGRISSVVELTGKDGNSESFNMGAGISLLSVNGFIEAPFAKGKGAFLVAGRRSFQSAFYSNIFDSFTQSNQDNNPNAPENVLARFGQQQVQPNSYFYDVNAKLSYKPNKKDIFSLSFYNGQDDLDNSRNTDNNTFRGGGFGGGNNLNFNFLRESTDLTQWGNWGGSAKWSRKWSDRFYSNANLSYSNYYSERDRRNNTTVERADTAFTRTNGSYEYNDLKDFTFKIDNEWRISNSNLLEFGIQSTYNDIQYEFTQNDSISVLDRANSGFTNAAYLQNKFTFKDKIILKGGLRASHYSVNNQLYFEPRASLIYPFANGFKLKGAWGIYQQFATRIVREDIQQGSRDFWLLANGEDNPIASAEHFIAGLSYETNNYLFDVEAYYKNLDGLSEYSTRFIPSGFGPNRTLDYEEFFYQGTGIARGLELLAQKKKGRFTGWVGYTLGQVRYEFDAFGENPFPANHDQTHELKIVANYKFNKITLGATFIYATGRPYTAPTGFYEVELLDGSTTSFFEVSDKNILRLPDYHRFDVSATYDFKMGGSKASMGLSLFNIYNRNNVWYKEFEVIEGELLETDVTLLNFTPSLFLNWSLH